MAGEWESATVEEIKTDTPNAIAMGPFGSRIKTDNFVSAGVPVIRGNNLNAWCELTVRILSGRCP